MNLDIPAAQILAMPLDQPGRLFTGELDKAKVEYQKLARKWHPDVNPAAGDVMAHINKLYEAAVAQLTAGHFRGANLLKMTAKDGRVFQLRYRKHRPFELGDTYIGDRVVAYSVKKEFKDLVDNGVSMMKNFKFNNDDMRKEAIRYLPEFLERIDLDDRILVVIGKQPDFYCLRDLVDKSGGKLDPKHAAWIMSRLHNLLCYFEFAKIAHNDISMDSYFVSPEMHLGCLLGGWWYARKEGDRMVALPERTLRYAPAKIVATKAANRGVDFELIRAVGREILGDPAGSRLATNKDVPEPMANWLRSPGSTTAYEDYRDWYDKVLPKSFGPRRFVRMEVPSGIYEE